MFVPINVSLVGNRRRELINERVPVGQHERSRKAPRSVGLRIITLGIQGFQIIGFRYKL